MSAETLKEIHQRLDGLTPEEQLGLVEQLVHRLRKKTKHDYFLSSLEQMAADPDIQREIKEINEEFAGTEMDGLEKL